MSDEQDYSLETARDAAARDDLDTWVARFLASPGSDNAPLAEELSGSRRWWAGPVQLPLDQLHRLAGPPGDPVLFPVDDDDWRDDVEEMSERIEQHWEPPPVVVSYRDGQLVLEDGNHRVESLRQAGRDQTWAVIAFETAEERDDFVVPDAS